MANLVICCDGTWNTPEQRDGGLPAPTNIAKIYASLADTDGSDDTGTYQKRFYRKGVGTTGGPIARLKDGAFATNINNDIISAYKALGDMYEEHPTDPEQDDKLFLFGFSRGAFAVRSLTGLIERCGIPNFDETKPYFDQSKSIEDQKWRIAKQAYAHYRKKTAPDTDIEWPRHKRNQIEFLGVFDTVGSLGVPEDLRWLNPFSNPQKYQFHNIQLSNKVYVARHAIAMDERRSAFQPTLWNNTEGNINVQQRWFPGVHSDVGGGYQTVGLSDRPLEWMIDEARKRGLAFDPVFTNQIAPNDKDVLNESATSIFRKLKVLPRSVPNVAEDRDLVDASARNRQAERPIRQPNYWKARTLNPDTPKTVRVPARSRWRATGIFLEEGKTYTFTANGQWLDKGHKCGPDGFPSTSALFGLHKSLFIDALEIFEKLVNMRFPTADVWWTRRHPEIPWFALTGCVANGRLKETTDEEDIPHQHFKIGTGTTFSPDRSGFLYCYANDAWHYYLNNAGTLHLTITEKGDTQAP